MVEFTPCTQGKKALKLLHAQKKRFDLIIADAEMVEINVFKFIETVQTTLDIPIVLMSEMYKYAHARKAIECGVSDIICTPTIQELKIIWKFVWRRKLSTSGKNRRNEDENGNARTTSMENDNDENIRKKPRWRWTDELHEKFIFALKQLGLSKASPKKIIGLMDVPNMAELTVSGYLQTFRECVKEKGVTDWTQISAEMIKKQIWDSRLQTLTERRQRLEQSMSRLNTQSWNSGQSNVSTANFAPLTGNSNYVNHLNPNNLSIKSGVDNMDVPTPYPNHIEQNQSGNIFGLMQQSYSPAVNQTANNFNYSGMARNQLSMGQKYAPTAILPESSAAVGQSKNFLPLRNAYSLLNQLQSNAITASMSNWLGNNSANRVQISNVMSNNAANVLQSFNNFGMMQNSSDVNQVQNRLNNFTGNTESQNTNAMEFNSANQGIGGFEMIQNNMVVRNEQTEAPYQGCNIFSDVNENSIGQNHNTMQNNSVFQSVGAIGMMQNHQIGFDEYMGAPYRGQSSSGAPNGNFMDQNPNALVNSSAVQGNGAVGTMQNSSINENAYGTGVTYQVQNSSNEIIGSNGVGSSERAVYDGDFVSELLNLDVGRW